MHDSSVDRQSDLSGTCGTSAACPRPPSEPTLRIASFAEFLGRGPRLLDLADAQKIRFTYSGRYAIYHSLRCLATITTKRVVLVPAYHCPTVVDPILHAGFTVKFYEVTTDLKLCRADFERKLSGDVAAAVLIRYFGLPSGADPLIELCRAAGVVSIDDCSHSFLACSPLRLSLHSADITIYSFKKLVPSQCGGGVVASNLPLSPTRLKRATLRSSYSRARTLWSNARASRPAFRSPGGIDCPDVTRLLAAAQPAIRRSADIAYPYDPTLAETRIPFTSRLILTRTPLRQVAARRQRNYSLLAKLIHADSRISPVAPNLPIEICPWGFPTLLANRSAHDYRLRALGVPLFTFGEVLHPLLHETHADETRMLESSRFLADSVLALSVHQDLDEGFVRQFADSINEYFSPR